MIVRIPFPRSYGPRFALAVLELVRTAHKPHMQAIESNYVPGKHLHSASVFCVDRSSEDMAAVKAARKRTKAASVIGDPSRHLSALRFKLLLEPLHHHVLYTRTGDASRLPLPAGTLATVK